MIMAAAISTDASWPSRQSDVIHLVFKTAPCKRP
jgi:hypothetical protein